MQKTHCSECQGIEFYDTVLSARNGVIIGRRARTGDEWILVRCLICLSCGNISPYLDDNGLQKLRGWAYAQEQDAGAYPESYPEPARDQAPAVASDAGNPSPKTESAGFGMIIVLCLLVGVLLGVAVIIYGIMHQQ